jgi:hypothetical protein
LGVTFAFGAGVLVPTAAGLVVTSEMGSWAMGVLVAT